MHPCTSVVLHSDSTLREAAERVLMTGMDALPVTDESGRFVGLIAQAALIRELLSGGSAESMVGPIVSHSVDSARTTTAVDSVLPLFRSAAITMVPVVDENDCPVGMIHRRDVINYLLEESPEERGDTTSSVDDTDRVSGPHFLRKGRRTSNH